MTLAIEKNGSGNGCLIRAHSGQDLMDLPVDDIKEIFKSAGALLFRGFNADPWSMKSFANQFSVRFNRDRLRPQVENSGGFIQKVNEGMGIALPHCEQANSPFRPDAIWFCCTRPAKDGGETLFWDGISLWDDFPLELKAKFTGKKLRFFQRYPPDRWQLFLGEQATLEDVRQALDGVEGVSYFISDDQSVYLEYVCPAVVETRYGGHKAFANSLISERKNTLGELMSFSDGTPITDAMVEDLHRHFDANMEEIHWEPGDLVVLDNSRYLHGRNAFSDPERQIHSCLSFLNF